MQTELLSPRARVQQVLKRLTAAFVERDELMKLAMLSLLSGQHVLLLGPPGVGKSQLARSLAQSFHTSARSLRYFEYVLTRFSHPDELLGPLSIPALREARYERVSEGYLPWAELAFLDEFFKAGSALLNSLLSILNERVLHVGSARQSLPLFGLIAASNEGPGEDEALQALYDRFLVRIEVEPVQDSEAFLQVALGYLEPLHLTAEEQLSLEEVRTWQAQAHQLPFSSEFKALLVALRESLGAEPPHPSVRRWRQAMQWLQMAAYTSGDAQVEAVHLWLLERVLEPSGQSRGELRALLKRVFEQYLREHFLDPCQEAFESLSLPLDESSREAMQRAQSQRVQEVRGGLRRTQDELEELRQRWLSHLRSHLWFSQSEELEVRLLTLFATSQQRLLQASKSLESYGLALGLGADSQSWLRRARHAQAKQLGEQPREEEAVAWLRLDSEEPESWLPLSESGYLLVEAAPRLAGRLQRQLNERGQHSERVIPMWWETVVQVPINSAGFWALSAGGSKLQHWLESQSLSLSVQAALVSLGAWLRAGAVSASPELPQWPS